VAGATDKTSYAPGETVSVTISGGYRSGWVRAILYDQNMTELARSTGPNKMGGGSGFPITLTAAAPATSGTYTWNVAWYGNKYDSGGALFGSRWSADAGNSNHGQEIVTLTPFTVSAAAAPSIGINPTALDFGTVTVGSNVTMTTQVQNKGTATLNVTGITPCSGTSSEFTWSPSSAFTVAPGGNVVLSVDFKPVDTLTHSGCLQIASNDTATPSIPLNLTAAATATTSTPPPTDGASLYTQYCAGCHHTLATSNVWGASAAKIQSAISGVGQMQSLSTLSSSQIQAIAAALSSTTTPPPPQTGVDLNITGFSATRSVSVGSMVNFRLRVTNPSSVSGTAEATLVGRSDGTQLYSKTMSVTASPGSDSQSFTFPAYKATTPGVITWTVTINDMVPDKATATTTVYKGRVPQREERDD